MEMRNSSFSAMHHGKEEPGYTRHLVTPGTIISPHLFTYFTLNLPQSLKALLRNNDIQFMEALQKLPAHLVGKIHPFCFHILPSVSIHSFWKLCGLPFPLCQDLGVSFAYL